MNVDFSFSSLESANHFVICITCNISNIFLISFLVRHSTKVQVKGLLIETKHAILEGVFHAAYYADL